MSKYFVNPHKLSLEVCHLENARKNMPKAFLQWKACLNFFKILCFQQPLRCYKNDLVTSTVIVRSSCGLLWIIPWGLSHSIMQEKIGQKLFFTGKIAFFFQRLCFQQPFRCYRNDLVTSTLVVKKPCGFL